MSTDPINPYYHPEKCGLNLLYFNEPDLSYEYNTLCFWATFDGRIYTASDRGCSCSIPFENAHARATPEEVIATLERVGSLEQALSIFDSWNRFDIWPEQSSSKNLSADDRRELEVWFNQHFKI